MFQIGVNWLKYYSMQEAGGWKGAIESELIRCPMITYMFPSLTVESQGGRMPSLPPSSSGLGRGPLKAETGVRFPVGAQSNAACDADFASLSLGREENNVPSGTLFFVSDAGLFQLEAGIVKVLNAALIH